jgi:hypothetical protein
VDISATQQWLLNFIPDSTRLTRAGFCIHLKSLKVSHFKIVEVIRLQIMASRSPSAAWLTPLLNFHKNLQIVSKVIRRTDRLAQNSDLISFPSILFKKNKLKIKGRLMTSPVSQSVCTSVLN